MIGSGPLSPAKLLPLFSLHRVTWTPKARCRGNSAGLRARKTCATLDHFMPSLSLFPHVQSGCKQFCPSSLRGLWEDEDRSCVSCCTKTRDCHQNHWPTFLYARPWAEWEMQDCCLYHKAWGEEKMSSQAKSLRLV